MFDIFKSAGVLDGAQIVEGIAFYALIWQLRDDPILKKKFKLDNSQYKDLTKFILQAGGMAISSASPEYRTWRRRYVRVIQCSV